jgi:hypothetical protein
VKRIVRIAKLERADFGRAVHIPEDISQVIFAESLFVDITENDWKTLNKIYKEARTRIVSSDMTDLVETVEKRSVQRLKRLLTGSFADDMTLEQMTEVIKYRMDQESSQAREMAEIALRKNFLDLLQLTRILIRELKLNLHDIPNFFHLDIKAVDNIFGSVEPPLEFVPTYYEDDGDDDVSGSQPNLSHIDLRTRLEESSERRSLSGRPLSVNFDLLTSSEEDELRRSKPKDFVIMARAAGDYEADLSCKGLRSIGLKRISLNEEQLYRFWPSDLRSRTHICDYFFPRYFILRLKLAYICPVAYTKSF